MQWQRSASQYRAIFYGSWLLLSFLQAGLTPVQDDEAYYWVFSQFLGWGYFDHPPLIALQVKLGHLLLGGAWGLRLLSVLMSAALVYMVERMLRPANILLYYALVLSVVVLQLSGFWAVPDVPLMFFTALYFLAFRRFLRSSTASNTLLLALAIAGMFYSKYHGLLVVVFSFAAVPRLFLRYQSYLAAALVTGLYMPHLWWQHQHEWVTFRFQLFENKAHPYQWNFTGDYVLGQLLITGPLVGPILLAGLVKEKWSDEFERALKISGIGILVFFLLSSLRGQVEANWTAPALVPMLYFGYRYVERHAAAAKWLWRLLPYSFALAVFGRIAMIADILPVEAVVERFHSWKEWPATLKAETEGKPVVFYDSYQRASQYWYHTGTPAYSLNSYGQRRNSYSFWPVEDSLLGKEVYRMSIYETDSFDRQLKARLWTIGYTADKGFQSYARVQLTPEKDAYKIAEGEWLTISASVQVPAAHELFLQANPAADENIRLVFYKAQDVVQELDIPTSLREVVGKKSISIDVSPGLPPGRYKMIFAISSEGKFFTHNSYPVTITVR